ncbi:MAG TPA: PspC domain-containing protein [Chitinophagaceae bacterium]|nr:PspC domain-containing protein [Chitinophagaceae bacterium]
MKKIININLSGRVIPIEDAAYESLQRYIESLRRYFAGEEGRDEIINDIESRIAELMNDKVKKGASAVTEEDMEEIISAMGRIEDFEKVDAAENAGSTTGTFTSDSNAGQFAAKPKRKGRLYRDKADKILGGVCAGIANYMNVDPAIIRLLFAIITFGGFGFGIVIYLLLWIILPARDMEGFVGKRLFRNPEDKIIGGVAGGLAAYFNRETWIIRVIFAAPLIINIILGVFNGIFNAFHGPDFPNIFVGSFTGTFVLAYIILWIVLPEARSPFEKMEMRGETVDVNRIRQNVQEGMSDFKNRAQTWGQEVKESAQNLGDRASQFANTRGKTFAAEVAQTARPVASGCGHAIGVLFKAFFLFVVGAIAFGLFVTVLVFTVSGVARPVNDFLLNGFWQSATLWGVLIFFLAVPLIAIITWIVRRMMKVRSQNRYLGWTFAGLWTLGWICLGYFIASMARDWRYYNNVSEEITMAQPIMNKMIVRVNEPAIRYSGNFDWIDSDDEGWDITDDSLKLSNVKVRIEKSEDSNYHVTMLRYSAGRNRGEAQQRAQKISYAVSSMDSALILGSGFGVTKEQKFRGQKVIVEIAIPVGKQIRFHESVVEKLNQTNVRIRERVRNGYRYRREWDMDWDDDSYFNWKPGVDYVMNADGDLIDPLNPRERSTQNNTYEYRGGNTDSIFNDTINTIPENRLIEERIREQRRKVEEERRKLEDLQKDRNRRGTSKNKSPLYKETNITAQIQSPVFSLI